VVSECSVGEKHAKTKMAGNCEDVYPSSTEAVHTTASVSNHSLPAQSSVVRISLPLLTGSAEAQYTAQRNEEATPLVWNCDMLKCDEPLQLQLSALSTQGTATDSNLLSTVQLTNSYKQTCLTDRPNAFSALITAYDDDDTE